MPEAVMLNRGLASPPYLVGPEFNLAEMFLLPLIYYLQQMPESGELLTAAPNLTAWLQRVSDRPSARQTVPPPMPKRD
jgi:glutathione S-transferase